MTSRGGKVQLTAAQAAALLEGYNLVKGIRTTVKSASPGKDVLLAYGVGSKPARSSSRRSPRPSRRILARVAAEPAEAASFNIVQADVAALKASLTAIQDADTAQEAARAAAPQTTAQRNATASRILAAIKKIAGAGMRSFPSDATVYANFESLITKKAG